MVLKNAPISLNWMPDADYIGASHRQLLASPGIMVGNEAQKVRAMTSLGPGSISYSISLSRQWLDLPTFSGGMASTWSAGDKFEVLVHELTHSVLGTIDVESKSGKTAYGGKRCRLLAQKNPGKALVNADNWGFFIEEFHELGTMDKYG